MVKSALFIHNACMRRIFAFQQLLTANYSTLTIKQRKLPLGIRTNH
jgi:hypothetical protein